MKSCILFVMLLSCLSLPALAEAPLSLQDFKDLASPNKSTQHLAKERLKKLGNSSHSILLLELAYLKREARSLFELLPVLSAQSPKASLSEWYEWIWSQPYDPPPYYADFKSWLYSGIDPRFAKYFNSSRKAEIRLDEVRWGGVRKDGIPPLRNPSMLPASEADYLEDKHIVFGVSINGDTRAYPKRILAWHELFTDTVGGVPITGAYCTLCGSMIIYESESDGQLHELGTSGFLYNSNKLMYDRATDSLWNTLLGEPVIGPLVGKRISLKRRSVVTTSWGEWRKRHPQTTVLSLDTGHRRDYGEGVAYKDYFATDRLMFNVSRVDTRLANKEDVLGLVFAEEPGKALAISSSFLKAHPIYSSRLGNLEFIILTDKSGAHRVFEKPPVTFSTWLQDNSGQRWEMREDSLRNSKGQSFKRLPSHNAFWFGWYAAYPHTFLISE